MAAMDEIVKQAMAKWPNVPDCYGWLGLDARGTWYMRDERVQATGTFTQARGSALRHDKLRDFIARNYASDALGRWFFQNGPQRVFVELESTPWVWRLQADEAAAATPALPRVTSHTGRLTHATQCLVDEQGCAYLTTPLGLGRVHSQDMGLLADALAVAAELPGGGWPLVQTTAAALPSQWHFVPSPLATRPA